MKDRITKHAVAPVLRFDEDGTVEVVKHQNDRHGREVDSLYPVDFFAIVQGQRIALTVEADAED